MPLFALMRRARRTGLRLAWLLGALGSVLVAGATLNGSVGLLLAGMLLFGCASAGSDAARYAAADLATDRGRAIGSLVFASTLTAIVGPNLLGPAGTLASDVGLPGYAGPFLLSAILFAGAGLVLDRLLRPDPLEIRAGRVALLPADAARYVASLRSRAGRQAVGVVAMAIANFAMVFAMTATPTELNGTGHDLRVIGFVVSLHIAAMFAPSYVSGWLTDRLGPGFVIGLSGLAFALAGPLVAVAARGGGTMAIPMETVDMTTLTAGLVALGVAWNLALVAGSALLDEDDGSGRMLRVQGLGEGLRGVGGLAGALLAGIVLAGSGLAGIGTVTAIVAVPLLALGAVEPVRRALGIGLTATAGDGRANTPIAASLEDRQ